MKVKHAALVVAIGAGLFVAPVAAEAEQARKVHRIGYMSLPSRESAEHLIPVFRQALRERGLVEGENLIIEWRWAEGKLDRLPVFARELVQLKVDLIIAPQTASALAAKRATATIPIVFLFAEDPVADGLVASLPRPGANVTGLTYTPGLETYAKQLELLKEALPKVSRVAVLIDPARSDQGVIGALQATRVAADALGVKLLPLELRGPNPDLESAFRTATSERVGALLFRDRRRCGQ